MSHSVKRAYGSSFVGCECNGLYRIAFPAQGAFVMSSRSNVFAIPSLLVAIVVGLAGVFPRDTVWAQAVATASETGTRTVGHGSLDPDQERWLKATLEERVRIVEEIGEKGAREYAKGKGYKTIFDGMGRTVPQGPDQVYLDPRTGETVVVEAKGGTSPLGRGYGYQQGTKSWAVKSAEQILHNPNASPAEREAAKQVIEAMAEGKLRVEVVRTPHVQGKAGKPVLEVVEETADDAVKAAQLAKEIMKRFPQIFTPTPKTSDSNSKSLAKAVAEFQRRPFEPPIVPPRTYPNPRPIPPEPMPPDVDRFVTRLPGAPIGGEGLAGTLGKAAGVAGIAVDGVSRAYRALEVEKAYKNGEITQHERTVEHAKNVAGCVGGWTGAWAGAEFGGSAGAAIGTAVCPGIGTAIGGIVGGLAGGIGGYFAGEKVAEEGTELLMGR